ncbi:cbb3-type cytochrome c oxidase subunit I [Marinobacter sp. M3C]|jgi:cytochrome c oxidase cbb3-type subunit 1|uniref:cbb3-type cytochrome c oxidase subunit I n=1 Tax=unclassified Marinobacter TaxID=83889 RepID=UPI0020106B26|nr:MULTISPECIES: cbb3-type cytochrome c oxidase subunit I [unclassified Marinobacter]MCL1478591.1 cbb3-type cytochrome c oxidase subunit I [Marinobacter sp.]UQG57934.1 cbb3-type cytochrome c oxidase subunit I [Marinobacter sp. M4C]UQG60796.1 cbb3-type cytochrome c oxidase subunit I [Marinobacter sp. M3C]UQG66739.1 cbb3-type cytochrome c oxidase subunit I [Marinobacter sp. M2C]UQG71019.1 cbb3-type cytochrome c oxidase subunit I [Marinobacter sp. M1C]
MTPTIAILLIITFVLSTVGLLLLIWSIANNQFSHGQEAARSIFSPGEEGHSEDPARPADPLFTGENTAQAAAIKARWIADQSSRTAVLTWLSSSIFWLVLGSFFGLVSSIKMHLPEFLAASEFLTFGRIRPAHLNAVTYGWASMAGIGVALFLIPRLFKTSLAGGKYAVFGAVIWNIGLILGLTAIIIGLSDGKEWLEFPWQIDILFVVGGALCAIPLLLTAANRQVEHLYVSSWYLMAALVWFPILFLIANLPFTFPGASGATVNWWFAHNVLGLWVTPIGIGIAYYMIPKILGKPIISYQLSLIGFWSLALFYSQVGIHHIIGGPIPTWLVTLSIVHSVMMSIPVITVAINHHGTMMGNFGRLKDSPTLRFVWIGALMYTVASLQGSMEALRSVNVITHFTHYTIAHAHLGMYAFLSFILFGAIYFIMPRLTNWEWPWRRLISLHFWLVSVGIVIYVVSLTIAGWKQGVALLDAAMPFMDIVRMTMPALQARTVGGALMTLGHLVFAFHFVAMLTRRGIGNQQPTLFRPAIKEITQ